MSQRPCRTEQEKQHTDQIGEKILNYRPARLVVHVRHPKTATARLPTYPKHTSPIPSLTTPQKPERATTHRSASYRFVPLIDNATRDAAISGFHNSLCQAIGTHHKGHPQGVPLPIVILFRPRCRPPFARDLWNLRLSAMGCTVLDGLPCKRHTQGVPLPIVNLFRPRCRPPFARDLWNLRLSAMGCTVLDGLPCKGHPLGVPLPIVKLFRPGCWPPLARGLWNLRRSAMGCTGLDGLPCKGHAQGVPLLFGQPHEILS